MMNGKSAEMAIFQIGQRVAEHRARQLAIAIDQRGMAVRLAIEQRRQDGHHGRDPAAGCKTHHMAGLGRVRRATRSGHRAAGPAGSVPVAGDPAPRSKNGLPGHGGWRPVSSRLAARCKSNSCAANPGQRSRRARSGIGRRRIGTLLSARARSRPSRSRQRSIRQSRSTPAIRSGWKWTLIRAMELADLDWLRSA